MATVASLERVSLTRASSHNELAIYQRVEVITRILIDLVPLIVSRANMSSTRYCCYCRYCRYCRFRIRVVLGGFSSDLTSMAPWYDQNTMLTCDRESSPATAPQSQNMRSSVLESVGNCSRSNSAQQNGCQQHTTARQQHGRRVEGPWRVCRARSYALQ